MYLVPKFVTLKLLGESIGSLLHDASTGRGILNWTLSVQELRLIMDKLNIIKVRRFCTAKEMINQVKRKYTE